MNVFCVYWGDKYSKNYVYALKAMVERYLTIEHEFICITTDSFPGIQTIKPHVPYYGWWQKIGLFAPRIATGPSIYLDLDVVITGNINYLTDYLETETIAAPANWAQSGHGGIQSSVMVWGGNYHVPFEKFDYAKDSERLWGDQEYLWELLGDKWDKIPGIGSYKYHVRPTGFIPDWMNICVFHGKPDPHEVKDKCLQPYISTHVMNINESTVKPSNRGLSGTG